MQEIDLIKTFCAVPRTKTEIRAEIEDKLTKEIAIPKLQYILSTLVHEGIILKLKPKKLSRGRPEYKYLNYIFEVPSDLDLVAI